MTWTSSWNLTASSERRDGGLEELALLSLSSSSGAENRRCDEPLERARISSRDPVSNGCLASLSPEI